jgi:iron complex outermembrane receptor protein
VCSNKLLVQIDGRIVYDSQLTGVYWDVQDVLLEDIDRIEVVRGPGSSVWGSNAVDGVINVITKSADATKGLFFEGGGGSHEQGFSSVRYGGVISDDLSYRVYGKWSDTGPYYDPYYPANDAWQQARAGFRMDWHPSTQDTITFQGDYYNGYDGETSFWPTLTPPWYFAIEEDTAHVSGDNLMLHWRRVLDDQSDWTAKIYYDQTERHFFVCGIGDNQDTFDCDFQYRFPLGKRNEMVCGLEYRNVRDSTQGTAVESFVPSEVTVNYYSCFVQDQFTVKEDLCSLTVGSKFERDDFTGFEWEPTIRLLLTPSKQVSMWASVSRAVRTPAIAEEYLQQLSLPISWFPPTFDQYLGNRNLQSEEEIAYEAGIRGQATENLSADLTVFLNDYDRLIFPAYALPPDLGPIVVYPMPFTNAMRGDTYGLELAANYKVTPAWKVRASYSCLVMDLQPELDWQGYSPRNEVYLQSSFDLGRHWELDLIGRYVENLPAIGIPKYIVGDVRLAWRPNDHFEFAVVGRNLGNGNFSEFSYDVATHALPTEVVPEVYGQLTWRY